MEAVEERYREKLKRHNKKKKTIYVSIMAVVVAAAIAVTVFFTAYITRYRVEGNQYVQEEQIIEELFATPKDQRFFYSLFHYLLFGCRQADCLESYELKFGLDLSVTVKVQEQEIVGAARWEDKLYYFDRNGYIMAVDAFVEEAVPVVEGLAFENLSVYDRLHCSKGEMVDSILLLTQLLREAQIDVDSMSYDENGEVTIAFAQVKVALGSSQAMAGKIAELKDIIDSGTLGGLRGTLHMENYTEMGNTSGFIFDRE